MSDQQEEVSVWVLIRDWLSTHGGTDTIGNIADGLTGLGVDLGRYPARNIYINVTSGRLDHVFICDSSEVPIAKRTVWLIP